MSRDRLTAGKQRVSVDIRKEHDTLSNNFTEVLTHYKDTIKLIQKIPTDNYGSGINSGRGKFGTKFTEKPASYKDKIIEIPAIVTISDEGLERKSYGVARTPKGQVALSVTWLEENGIEIIPMEDRIEAYGQVYRISSNAQGNYLANLPPASIVYNLE